MSLYNGEASVVCLSVCKLLRKSLLLAGKWPDRHQTFTGWTPDQRASRVCSRSRSKVTWCAHFLGFLEWATPSLTVWFILLCFRFVFASVQCSVAGWMFVHATVCSETLLTRYLEKYLADLHRRCVMAQMKASHFEVKGSGSRCNKRCWKWHFMGVGVQSSAASCVEFEFVVPWKPKINRCSIFLHSVSFSILFCVFL